MFRFLFFILVFASPRAGANIHAFHTSLTEMEYNAQSKVFEVSIRIFTDDLENTINQTYKVKMSQLPAKQADLLMNQYIQAHFGLISPNPKKTFTWIGREIEGDATWIYIEIPFTQNPKGFLLQNDILFEMFDDQTNLVNLKYGSQRKSYLFKGKQSTAQIE